MAMFSGYGEPKHVYVMLSADGLVKVGISGNILIRANNEFLFGEKKEIVAICYSSEKVEQDKARFCEAAILGLHRKYLIGSSEWLSARWETVVQTLNSIFDRKTNVIQINDEKRIDTLNDEFMRNKGYSRKYFGKHKSPHYLKFNGDMCILTWRCGSGKGEEKTICTLPLAEMMDYLMENKFEFVKYLE